MAAALHEAVEISIKGVVRPPSPSVAAGNEPPAKHKGDDRPSELQPLAYMLFTPNPLKSPEAGSNV